MATKYIPVAGTISLVDGWTNTLSFPLPTGGGGSNATSPARQFPVGTPLLNNGAYGVEPCLCDPTGVGNASMASLQGCAVSGSVGSGIHANFCGLAGEARWPQMLNNLGVFSNGGGTSVTVIDASSTNLPVYAEGIARAPFYDGVNSTVQTQIEIGTLVTPTIFVNEASVGFYGPDSTLHKDTSYYAYMNSVNTTTDPNQSIGVVSKRALVGDSTVEFQFKSTVISSSGLIA
jgi:hypothetical protein